MTSPLVSVVIPTYNAPALLAETLATVFAQTFGDYEVVIVNDGSTDDTADRLREIAAHEPRARVITQDNQGIGAARNRGIDESRGRYIALLDHDDLWRPEKLAVQVDFMERRPACLSCVVPWELSDTRERRPPDPDAVRNAEGYIHPRLRAQAENLLISSAIMVRREGLGGLRFATRRNCIEDVPFYVGLIAGGPVGLAGDEVLMTYRRHATNFSKRADFFANGIDLLRELDDAGTFAALTPDERPVMLDVLASLSYRALVYQLRAGRRRAALALYARELRHLLRAGRYRFAVAYPLMAVAPEFVQRWRWGHWHVH